MEGESECNGMASSLGWEILLPLPRYRLGNTFNKSIQFNSIQTKIGFSSVRFNSFTLTCRLRTSQESYIRLSSSLLPFCLLPLLATSFRFSFSLPSPGSRILGDLFFMGVEKWGWDVKGEELLFKGGTSVKHPQAPNQVPGPRNLSTSFLISFGSFFSILATSFPFPSPGSCIKFSGALV